MLNVLIFIVVPAVDNYIFETCGYNFATFIRKYSLQKWIVLDFLIGGLIWICSKTDIFAFLCKWILCQKAMWLLNRLHCSAPLSYSIVRLVFIPFNLINVHELSTWWMNDWSIHKELDENLKNKYSVLPTGNVCILTVYQCFVQNAVCI